MCVNGTRASTDVECNTVQQHSYQISYLPVVSLVCFLWRPSFTLPRIRLTISLPSQFPIFAIPNVTLADHFRTMRPIQLVYIHARMGRPYSYRSHQEIRKTSYSFLVPIFRIRLDYRTSRCAQSIVVRSYANPCGYLPNCSSSIWSLYHYGYVSLPSPGPNLNL